MGDGWETKRNRTPNNKDWVIIRLAHAGTLSKILVDTCHFKGNYPDSCSIEACTIYKAEEKTILSGKFDWNELLHKKKLAADKEQTLEKEI